MEDLRTTQEWLNNLNDGTKDMLCDIYEYIDKWKDSSEPWAKVIDFTPSGIHFAKCNTQYYNATSEKFINKFHQNLDLIKVLVDNRPTKTFRFTKKQYSKETKFTTDTRYGRREQITTIEIEPLIKIITFKYYNEREMEHHISINQRQFDSNKEILK